MSTPSTPAHTPAPWSYFRSDGTIAAGLPAHTIARANYGDNWQANAAHIVTACNSHDKLREALRRMLAMHDDAMFICGSDDAGIVEQNVKAARAALKESEAK